MAALATAILAALAVAASAAPRLSVSGSIEPAKHGLTVRVALRNQGDEPADTVAVEGELLGLRAEERLDGPLPPGQTRSLRFDFPVTDPPPGRHALTLLIDYARAKAGQTLSQCAYLLLALGANPPLAVRLGLDELALDTMGTLPVRLESADGAPHTAHLRVLTPRGLRADTPPAGILVPARGAVTVPVQLYRGSLPRDTRQGVLAVASVAEGGLERTAVTTGVIRLLPDPALLPRLRPWLFGLALALVLAAVAIEVVALRRVGSAPA